MRPCDVAASRAVALRAVMLSGSDVTIVTLYIKTVTLYITTVTLLDSTKYRITDKILVVSFWVSLGISRHIPFL